VFDKQCSSLSRFIRNSLQLDMIFLNLCSFWQVNGARPALSPAPPNRALAVSCLATDSTAFFVVAGDGF
jgi:hypothetical protein